MTHPLQSSAVTLYPVQSVPQTRQDMTRGWRFFIDVGGTFTDVVVLRPDGRLVTHKLLSSGATRGVVERGSTPFCIKDGRRIGDPQGFWVDYEVTLLGTTPVGGSAGTDSGPTRASSRVVDFSSATGALLLQASLPWFTADVSVYELRSSEEAPVTAIRYLMGIGLHDPIGPVEVRLGTTRATNALLERKGAKVALVTTKGFGDILKIGYQDRPALFDLNVRKRDELATVVVEIDERVSATGEILRSPNGSAVGEQLRQVRAGGIQAVAICLLHSHVNPVHEAMVAGVAESVCSAPGKP